MRLTILISLFTFPFLIGQNLQFVEISDQAGTGNGPDYNGVIVGDFNRDGFEDLFAPSRSGDNRLFINEGDGTFDDRTSTSGIETGGITMTAVCGDLDNDGDLDLYLGNYYTAGAPISNFLYLNDGQGNFTDVTESSGLNSFDQTRSVHVVDIDNDGLLDIYVCNLLQQNVYWKNMGNGTFQDFTFFSGLFDTMISMGAIFFDYDNDGDQDVYLTHDGNQAYIIYENDGTGSFTDVSFQTGLNVAGQGMGVDHGDVNNDGHLDIYVTNLGPNFLLVNDGTGRYLETAIQAQAADMGGMGWGCFFVDYDNDGWEDIYVINDSQFSPATNKLYRNLKDGTFSLVSEGSPLSSFYRGRGGTWADLNNDGYLEIIVANGQTDIGIQIFENQHSGNNWISFELEGTTVAKDAFGTRVQITTDEGIKIDEKTGGSGYASQTSHRVHFGLGQGNVSDVVITWPDGSVDNFPSLQINMVHKIVQGENGIDADGDGFSDVVDCDDTNPEVNPGVLEIVYNGLDDDCDPTTVDDDLDGDGFLLADDCNDNNFNVNPNANELCDGIDNNCDGEIDELELIITCPQSLQIDCNAFNAQTIQNWLEMSMASSSTGDPVSIISDFDLTELESLTPCLDPMIVTFTGSVCGNESSCFSEIFVEDTEAPYFVSSQPIVFICDGAGNLEELEAFMQSVEFADDCSNVLSIESDWDGTGFLNCEDGFIVSVIATDHCGYEVTESFFLTPTAVDADDDGYASYEDCDDMNDAVNPGMAEVPNNGIDDDCDGEIDETTSVSHLSDRGLALFPNPTAGDLYLKTDRQIEYVEVYNVQGQLISGVHLDGNKLDSKTLESGVYFLKLQIEGNWYSARVVRL